MQQVVQPGWFSFGLAVILAVITLATTFAMIKMRTEHLAKDGDKLDNKVDKLEKQIQAEVINKLNELITLFKVAGAEQTAFNSTTTAALKAITEKQEKIEARQQAAEAALMILKGECPLLHDLSKKIVDRADG
jgi:hypothetical protein